MTGKVKIGKDRVALRLMSAVFRRSVDKMKHCSFN